ncbi:PAS domain S-box protein, partial [Thermodesulfobacteriota bacterium]
MVTSINKTAEQLTGQTELQTLGRPLEDVFHIIDGETRKRCENPARRVLETGAQVSLANNTVLIAADGTERILADSGAPILDEEGEILGVVLVFRDVTEQQEVQNALQDSEEKHRRIFESIEDVYYEVSLKDYSLIEVSPSVQRILGFSREELTGTCVDGLCTDPKQIESHLADLTTHGALQDYEMSLRHKDGRAISGSISEHVVYDEAGEPWKTCGVLRDITDRKRAEEQVKAALKEKEILLREIHHRVKNNFALVCSLLTLQAEYADDTHHRLFEELEARVMSMAMAHEKLYKSESLAHLSLDEYIDGLIDHLIGSSALGVSIELSKEIHDVSFGLDTAIPLGFILTELVSNCLKHAFQDGRDGEIRIWLRSIPDDHFELVVSDNGVGIPEDTDLENPASLGMDLVNAFVAKLNGSIKILRE